MPQRFCLLLLLLLLGFSRMGITQPVAWQKIALDSVATLGFPGPATRQQVQGQLAYLYKAEQTICMALLSSNSLTDGVANNNDQFYEGAVKGILEKSGGKLVRQRAFQVGGFTGVEIQFDTPAKPQLPTTKFTRIVLVNGTLYTLNYWTDARQDEASVAERNQFFNSFQVSAKPAAVEESAYKLGKLLGKLTFYALLLAGIIALVRRLNKPKKSSNQL